MKELPKGGDKGVDISLAEFTETILNDSVVQVTPIAGSDETKRRVQTPLEKQGFIAPTVESTHEGKLRLTPSYEKRKDKEISQYQVSKDILNETVDEEAQFQQEKLRREQEELARKQTEELLLKEQQWWVELEKEKALLEEQKRKTQELKDRATPENIESKEKIESDVQQEFFKRLASAESVQMLEGTAGKLTEDETRKIQLRKVKLEARLWKLISAHNLAVTSCEIDPMLEEKYKTLKQNKYNDIATCEVMLEPVTSPMSDPSDKLEDKEKTPYVEKIPTMDPTEREFSERLGSME